MQAIALLDLGADDVEHSVDEFGTLGIVALCPVVSGAGLAVDEVVGAEDATEGPGADGVHGAGLEVNQDGPRHVTSADGLVEVDADALELEVGVTGVRPGGVDRVFITDHLPELGADLVSALPRLDVEDLPHLHEVEATAAAVAWRRRKKRRSGGGRRQVESWTGGFSCNPNRTPCTVRIPNCNLDPDTFVFRPLPESNCECLVDNISQNPLKFS